MSVSHKIYYCGHRWNACLSSSLIRVRVLFRVSTNYSKFEIQSKILRGKFQCGKCLKKFKSYFQVSAITNVILKITFQLKKIKNTLNSKSLRLLSNPSQVFFFLQRYFFYFIKQHFIQKNHFLRFKSHWFFLLQTTICLVNVHPKPTKENHTYHQTALKSVSHIICMFYSSQSYVETPVDGR